MSARQALACFVLALAAQYAWVCAASDAGEDSEAAAGTPAEATIRKTVAENSERFEIELGGRPLSFATPRRADGSRRLFILVEPAASNDTPCPYQTADPPRLLVEITLPPDGDATIRTVLEPMRASTQALACLRRGVDPADALVLADRGSFTLHRADDLAAPITGFEYARAVLPRWPGSAWSATARCRESLLLASPGALTLAGPVGETPLAAQHSVRIPLQAQRGPFAMRLRSRPATRLERRGSGPLYAVGPEAIGGTRLRTILVDPASEEEPRVERWSRLPSAEQVLDHTYAMIGDEPHLIATTLPAGKLNLFGEKRLRVFPLSARDRSRRGQGPVLAVETKIEPWEPSRLQRFDADGDGRNDLVITHWKGRKKPKLAFEVYRALKDGGFATSATRSSMRVEDPDPTVVLLERGAGETGRPGLLLQSGQRLLRYSRRSDTRGGKALFDEEPDWKAPLGTNAAAGALSAFVGPQGPGYTIRYGALGRPWLVDLDGDRRSEVLFVRDKARGGLVIVRDTR